MRYILAYFGLSSKGLCIYPRLNIDATSNRNELLG